MTVSFVQPVGILSTFLVRKDIASARSVSLVSSHLTSRLSSSKNKHKEWYFLELGKLGFDYDIIPK